MALWCSTACNAVLLRGRLLAGRAPSVGCHTNTPKIGLWCYRITSAEDVCNHPTAALCRVCRKFHHCVPSNWGHFSNTPWALLAAPVPWSIWQIWNIRYLLFTNTTHTWTKDIFLKESWAGLILFVQLTCRIHTARLNSSPTLDNDPYMCLPIPWSDLGRLDWWFPQSLCTLCI